MYRRRLPPRRAITFFPVQTDDGSNRGWEFSESTFRRAASGFSGRRHTGSPQSLHVSEERDDLVPTRRALGRHTLWTYPRVQAARLPLRRHLGWQPDPPLEANCAVAALDERGQSNWRGQESVKPVRSRDTIPVLSLARQSVSLSLSIRVCSLRPAARASPSRPAGGHYSVEAVEKILEGPVDVFSAYSGDIPSILRGPGRRLAAVPSRS